MVKSPAALHSSVRFAGHEMSGAVVSNIVTVAVHVDVFPQRSVAVNITI
jgi:hypothetical protein